MWNRYLDVKSNVNNIDVMDQVAESYYRRGVGMGEVRRPYSIHSDCKLAIRRYACFAVYQRCLTSPGEEHALSYNKVCRSACFHVKDTCSTFEDCVEAPASQCSGVFSDATKTAELSLLVITFLAIFVILL